LGAIVFRNAFLQIGDKMEYNEAQTKLGGAVMQALIKVSAVEKALLQKGILTDQELADALALVVSEVVKTAEEELGLTIEMDDKE
jgi:hypothetical protein